MAKKAKVTVRSYFKDLMGWFGLMKARQAWIDAGDPNIDTSDRSAVLAKQLHCDRVLSKIVKVTEETPTTRTFTLKAEEGYEMPFFNAGQHISVKFKINGNWVTRPFSVSSEPGLTDEGLLEITIRKMPGGYVSSWIWDNWQEGTEVIFSGAFGDGSYNSLRDAKHVVGIAGGSGITAFRSIARDMASSHRPEKLTILYGSRNEGDIIFFNELNEIAAASEGSVEVINVLSEPGDGWTGEKGFISADIIRKYVPDWADATYFVSGPQAMYDFLDGEFAKMGVKERRIRKEEYGETADITKSPLYPKGHENDVFRITVRFGLDERVIEAKATDTVVVSLEKAGIAPDTHCRSGACGWCRSLLISGEIWQRPQSDGVRASDRDYGYFHPCSAYPMSDLVIEVTSRLS